MSFLSIILFCVALAFLIFLTVVKNRASADLHTKLHPPKKEQEEFLKACELYLEYRQNLQEHPEPEADAKYDAAVWIRKEGFLPMGLEQLPVQQTDKRFRKSVDYKAILRADGEPDYLTYEAIRNVSREAFLECRKHDQLLSGYTQDPCFWNEGTFNAEAWKEYCAKMDAVFDEMVGRFLRETDSGTESGPGMNG